MIRLVCEKSGKQIKKRISRRGVVPLEPPGRFLRENLWAMKSDITLL